MTRLALGVVVVVTLLGCQALRTALTPRVPFPSTPSQSCQSGLTGPVPGGPAPTTDWQVAVEIDRPEGSAILFAAGSDSALCFVSRLADGSLGSVGSGSGGFRSSHAGLTLDLGIGTPKAQLQDILMGRVPTSTVKVQVTGAGGAVDAAIVANGYYLAWLKVPAVPVQIDALDAEGHLLERLADPNGIPMPSP